MYKLLIIFSSLMWNVFILSSLPILSFAKDRTVSIHRNLYGGYTDARLKLHQNIINNELIKAKANSTKAQFVILLHDKELTTKMVDQAIKKYTDISSKKGFVRVDAYALKDAIPETDKLKKTNPKDYYKFISEELADIQVKLIEKATINRKNIVISTKKNNIPSLLNVLYNHIYPKKEYHAEFIFLSDNLNTQNDISRNYILIDKTKVKSKVLDRLRFVQNYAPYPRHKNVKLRKVYHQKNNLNMIMSYAFVSLPKTQVVLDVNVQADQVASGKKMLQFLKASAVLVDSRDSKLRRIASNSTEDVMMVSKKEMQGFAQFKNLDLGFEPYLSLEASKGLSFFLSGSKKNLSRMEASIFKSKKYSYAKLKKIGSQARMIASDKAKLLKDKDLQKILQKQTAVWFHMPKNVSKADYLKSQKLFQRVWKYLSRTNSILVLDGVNKKWNQFLMENAKKNYLNTILMVSRSTNTQNLNATYKYYSSIYPSSYWFNTIRVLRQGKHFTMLLSPNEKLKSWLEEGENALFDTFVFNPKFKFSDTEKIVSNYDELRTKMYFKYNNIFSTDHRIYSSISKTKESEFYKNKVRIIGKSGLASLLKNKKTLHLFGEEDAKIRNLELMKAYLYRLLKETGDNVAVLLKPNYKSYGISIPLLKDLRRELSYKNMIIVGVGGVKDYELETPEIDYLVKLNNRDAINSKITLELRNKNNFYKIAYFGFGMESNTNIIKDLQNKMDVTWVTDLRLDLVYPNGHLFLKKYVSQADSSYLTMWAGRGMEYFLSQVSMDNKEYSELKRKISSVEDDEKIKQFVQSYGQQNLTSLGWARAVDGLNGIPALNPDGTTLGSTSSLASINLNVQSGNDLNIEFKGMDKNGNISLLAYSSKDSWKESDRASGEKLLSLTKEENAINKQVLASKETDSINISKASSKESTPLKLANFNDVVQIDTSTGFTDIFEISSKLGKGNSLQQVAQNFINQGIGLSRRGPVVLVKDDNKNMYFGGTQSDFNNDNQYDNDDTNANTSAGGGTTVASRETPSNDGGGNLNAKPTSSNNNGSSSSNREPSTGGNLANNDNPSNNSNTSDIDQPTSPGNPTLSSAIDVGVDEPPTDTTSSAGGSSNTQGSIPPQEEPPADNGDRGAASTGSDNTGNNTNVGTGNNDTDNIGTALDGFFDISPLIPNCD